MIWIAIAAATAMLVYFYRLVAVRRQWFDLPNERSSHAEPIPRGAGIVFVATICTGIVFELGLAEVNWPAILCASVVIAVVGWWDDVSALSIRFRFFIYGFTCIFAACLLLQPVRLVGLLQVGAIFSVALALLWWVNLYNFMDGINGLAVLEGLFITLSALILAADGGRTNAMSMNAMVAAGLVGFLFWNFPRARVFMGDAGSAFLGFVLGVIAVSSVVDGTFSLGQWMIIAGVFIVDATYTLFVRMLTGQRWREGHRSHAYQRLTDLYGSHARAVALLMSVNVFWLLPLAWLSPADSRSFFYVVLAYSPLVVACVFLQAGMSHPIHRTA